MTGMSTVATAKRATPQTFTARWSTWRRIPAETKRMNVAAPLFSPLSTPLAASGTPIERP